MCQSNMIMYLIKSSLVPISFHDVTLQQIIMIVVTVDGKFYLIDTR